LVDIIERTAAAGISIARGTVMSFTRAVSLGYNLWRRWLGLTNFFKNPLYVWHVDHTLQNTCNNKKA